MASKNTIGYAVRDATGIGCYYEKRTRASIHLVSASDRAKLYKTLREAEKQRERLDGRGFKDANGDAITFEVVEVKEKRRAA